MRKIDPDKAMMGEESGGVDMRVKKKENSWHFFGQNSCGSQFVEFHCRKRSRSKKEGSEFRETSKRLFPIWTEVFSFRIIAEKKN